MCGVDCRRITFFKVSNMEDVLAESINHLNRYIFILYSCEAVNVADNDLCLLFMIMIRRTLRKYCKYRNQVPKAIL